VIENRLHAQETVLDRLIDDHPGEQVESDQYRRLDLKTAMSRVVRDLENLLNCRREITPIPDAFKAIDQSVVVYGLKDYTAESPNDPVALQMIRKDVEATIDKFEPRLKNVTVQLVTGDESERKLSFRVSGLLVVDPIREPVTFDTIFDPSRKEYVISR